MLAGVDSTRIRDPDPGIAPSVATPFPERWREVARPEWMAGWAPRSWAVAGGTVEGIELGAGPALVMLPPLPGWKEAYLASAPLLARRFRVISFDLRTRFASSGIGPGARAPAAAAVPTGRRAAEWDQLVADARAIAAARAPGRVAVLGHSLGAALALRWAIAHPDQVRALVLSSGFARVFTPPGAFASRWLEQPLILAGIRLLPGVWSRRWARSLAARCGWVFDPFCDEAIVELMRVGIRAAPLALIRQRLALALGHDVRAALPSVRCPVLILNGARDTAFARAAADELSRLLPQASRSVVPGAGHLHPLSRAQEFADRVSEWLHGLPPPDTVAEVR
jgi:pimeloyl-ACP methyl ester carboxylesterase